MSANNAKGIGNIIAEAMNISARRRHHREEAKGSRRNLRSGRHAFDRGYISPYFVTNPEKMGSGSSRTLHSDL
jgi:chaperonin GroEL (HSP60 family)